jgi:hypothetical protein
VYQDSLCRFYVTEDVVDNIGELPEDSIFEAVSVRQAPADGKPVNFLANN